MNKKIFSISVIAVVFASAIGLVTIQNDNSGIVTNEIIYQEIDNSLPNYSLDYLASNAKYAIVGQVEKITPVFYESDEIEKTIFSDILVKVENEIGNNYSEEYITVRVHGGEIGESKTISHGNAEFEIDERVLFFVADKEPQSMWGDNYYVAGMGMGKYSLIHKQAFNEYVQENLSEEHLVHEITHIRG